MFYALTNKRNKKSNRNNNSPIFQVKPIILGWRRHFNIKLERRPVSLRIYMYFMLHKVYAQFLQKENKKTQLEN
jgi:hypothetical protein